MQIYEYNQEKALVGTVAIAIILTGYLFNLVL
jgi:hypothetical protein